MLIINPWIRCFNPNPDAQLRLFCFPYVGGGASIFRTWSDSLPLYVEVFGIQLPGREDRLQETPFTNISLLVQTLIPILRPHLNIPFTFFGHSMGALLGFELARFLRTEPALSPVHLFVSGRRAPQIPDRYSLIGTMTEREFIQELRDLNGTPKQVLENSELMKMFLPILRADFSICGTYTYLNQPPLDCSISAFGGTEDTGETYNLIEDWNAQTHSSFSLKMLPGDHFFLSTSQQQLLAILSHQLHQLKRIYAQK